MSGILTAILRDISSSIIRLTCPVLHGKVGIPARRQARVCVLTKPVLSLHYPALSTPSPGTKFVPKIDGCFFATMLVEVPLAIVSGGLSKNFK